MLRHEREEEGWQGRGLSWRCCGGGCHSSCSRIRGKCKNMRSFSSLDHNLRTPCSDWLVVGATPRFARPHEADRPMGDAVFGVPRPRRRSSSVFSLVKGFERQRRAFSVVTWCLGARCHGRSTENSCISCVCLAVIRARRPHDHLLHLRSRSTPISTVRFSSMPPGFFQSAPPPCG